MSFMTVVILCAVTLSASGVTTRRHDHCGSNATTKTPDPVTISPAGAFRGSWLETRHGRKVQAYRGIRYAESPVGALRFQPPKPIVSYPREVDATKDGPACPQPVENNYFVDEDCLRLNVYTRDLSGRRPVIFYMHSGGFYSISGRSDVAGPDYLLDKDIVLVTINYRLGSLGFISTGDALAPGNNGFKDQVVALKWVQRNIASFGGDPDLVTITGCSAGSFSVMLHMVSPMSKGLFHRAISISGSPISQLDDISDQFQLAAKQARVLGCPDDSSKLIIDCLKTKTSKELGDSLLELFEFAYDPVLLWQPIVEKDFGQERFLTEPPIESVKHGRMHSVPFIVSQTKDEFFYKALTVLKNSTLRTTMESQWHRIAPISFYLRGPTAAMAADRLKQFYLGGRPLVDDDETARGLGNLYSDAIIGFGVHRMANLMASCSAHPVYYYEFAYVGNNSHYTDPVTKRPVGAVHHDDLIYLFGIDLFPRIAPSSSPDSAMVERMTSFWYHFAKYGDPNPRGGDAWSVTWPRASRRHRYLRLDSEPSVLRDLFQERFHVWDQLYPTTYCQKHVD